MKAIRIAVGKGRLEERALELFRQMGLDCSSAADKGRKLIIPIDGGAYEMILAKAQDIITYVEHGVCDIGIVGKDTIMESGGSLFEVMDLGFGKCRMVLATYKDQDFYKGYAAKRVATKYPNIAKNYFASKGMNVDIVKIEGSVELAPLLNLADGIVDIVETGSTLKANGLEEKETIAHLSARLIVNIASMKMRKNEIQSFLERLQQAKDELSQPGKD